MKNLSILLLSLLVITISCKKSHHKTYPSNGLVAYFLFDDDYKDQKGFFQDGMPTGSPTFTAGKAGKAVTINATNQYLNLTPKNLTNSTSISVAFWVKSNISNATYFIYYANSTATCSYAFAGNSSTSAFRIVLPTDVLVQGEGNDNTWNHVVGTYNGTEIKIYINGQLKESKVQTEPIDGFMGSVYLGSKDISIWEGSLDDLFFYNRALTAAEVKQLYQYHL